MKNKNTKIAIIAAVALVLVTVGITYAYWLITRTQTKTNVIGAGCLDISLTAEQNDISLQNQFPLSDEEGMKLTPYTFTVTNNCNTSVDYQLNLELLGNEETSISSTSIKIGLNDSAFILGNKETRETTESNAYTSYQLMYGRLEAKGNDGSSDTHNLRLWLDKDAPIEEMNKTLESKIVLRAGQGIENPYNEGTIAFNIVGNAGGISYVNELSTEISEIKLDAEEAVWIPAPESLYWATDYKFDTSKGYTLSGDIVQATVYECREGTKECGNYMLGYSISSADDSATTLYNVTSFTSESGDWYITAKRSGLGNAFNFTSTEDEAKLNKTTDDLGDSYYYRGNIKNNYVKFGTYEENSNEVRGYESETSTNYITHSSIEECNSASKYNVNCTYIYEKGEDMYWRIIRTNGDGTVRMIYDGTEAVANGTRHIAHIGTSAYNTNEDNVKYLGYTYEAEDGTQTDSTIKSYIDTWYNTNLKTNYGTYISDSIFCNDRTSRTTEDGYTYYGAHDRLVTNKTPQLKCNQKSDKYTMNTEYGNGYLTNPVGLITADEVAYAGGVWTAFNFTYYLFNSDDWYWISEPYSFNSYSTALIVDSNGSMRNYPVTHVHGARPVINLKANVEFIGEGTIDSPYEIITE